MKHVLMGLLSAALMMNMVHAAPYGPKGKPATAIGANGQRIDIRVYGDEFYSYAKDAAGYTVIYDDAKKAHCYARLNATGDTLLSTGNVIGTVAPKTLGLAKGIRITADAQRAKAMNAYESTAAHMTCEKVRLEKKIRDLQLKGAPDAAINKLLTLHRRRFSTLPGRPAVSSTDNSLNSPPDSTTSGEISGVLILVTFQDDDSLPFATPQFDDFCNKTGYNEFGNTGSVKDYFYDQSLGNLTYTNTVVGYVHLPNKRSYYDDDMSIDIGDPSGSHKLVRDAVTVAMGILDFTQLSTHADGIIRGINIMYVGTAEYGKSLWPHRHVLLKRNEDGVVVLDPISVGDDKYVLDYQMTDIGETGQLTIGTFCHESGHLICGFGDYYDYGYDSEGIGQHCLMASGGYNNDGFTPAGINSYLRYNAGWLTPTTLGTSGTGSSDASKNEAYLFRKSSTEYFMIENRQHSQKWDAYLPDQGLVVWHVDETQLDNNDQNHYELDLEQADGNRDLNLGVNRGDSTDYFDSDTPDFSRITSPDSNWYDATASYLTLSNISASGTIMTFSYDTTDDGGSDLPDLKAFDDTVVSDESVVQETSFSIGLNILAANATAGSHTTTFYFSTDSIIDSSDSVLDSFVSSGISANTHEYQSVTALVPASVTPGTYYVGCLIDSNDSVVEGNETNNVFYHTTPIEVIAAAGTIPNLKDDGADSHTISSTSVNQTSRFSMGLDVRCTEIAAAAHTTNFYFSSDNTITSTDYLIGSYRSNGITANNWETQSATIQGISRSIPAGTYYVGCIIDVGGSISESNEGDNSVAFASTKRVTVSGPAVGGRTTASGIDHSAGGCRIGAATSTSLIPLLMGIMAVGFVRFRRHKA